MNRPLIGGRDLVALRCSRLKVVLGTVLTAQIDDVWTIALNTLHWGLAIRPQWRRNAGAVTMFDPSAISAGGVFPINHIQSYYSNCFTHIKNRFMVVRSLYERARSTRPTENGRIRSHGQSGREASKGRGGEIVLKA